MSTYSNERIAYFNGDFLPESRVLIPFRDSSFRRGDGCYDQARTFRKLKEHVQRLYRSLSYLEIDPDLTPAEMVAVSEEVVARNLYLLQDDDDFWIIQRISRRTECVGDESWARQGPTVVVECVPLPFRERAHLHRKGIHLVASAIRRTPPSSLSPRAKLNNYLNRVMAERSVKSVAPGAWGIDAGYQRQHSRGRVQQYLPGKGRSANDSAQTICFARYKPADGNRARERERYQVLEKDLDVFDAANAHEVFLTMTSMCVCPVSRFYGQPVSNHAVPGPVTSIIMNAFAELVGCDFVAQFERHLEAVN